MKIFSIVALMVQLILIGWSKYYEHIADTAIGTLSSTPMADVVNVASKFQYYNHLDNYLGYTAGAVWILVIIVVNLKKVVHTTSAKLSLYVPILFSLVLSFI